MSPSKRHDPAADGWAFGGEPVLPPAPSSIDLHIHTTRSDGVLAPGKLVADAYAAGVRLLALTDHDTLAGYRDVPADSAIHHPASGIRRLVFALDVDGSTLLFAKQAGYDCVVSHHPMLRTAGTGQATPDWAEGLQHRLHQWRKMM